MKRVVVVQSRPAFGEVEANLDRMEALLRDVEADLLVLPELFASGYAFRDGAEMRALAEPLASGRTVQRLLAWSERTGGIVVGGLPELDGDRVFNTAAIVAAGRLLGAHRKVHLFGFEAEAYAPGDGPFEVLEHDGLRVGTMICFDWIYPESARLLALAGADVIAHPSNLVLPWCQRSMPTRAIENRVFTATANRVGTEDRRPNQPLTFTGGSLVCDPLGEVLARAGTETEEILAVTIDPDAARDKVLPSGNDPLAERRPGFYGPLLDPVAGAGSDT